MNEKGFLPDRSLQNTLPNMYAKCGTLVEAQIIFDQMPKRSVLPWTLMIAAYAKHGRSAKVLTLYRQMQRSGVQPDQFVFGTVLPARARLADVERDIEIHKDIIKTGCEPDVFVESAFLDIVLRSWAFQRCPGIISPKFNKRASDMVSSPLSVFFQRSLTWDPWNMYAKCRSMHETLDAFDQIHQRNVVSWNAMITGYAQDGHVDEAYSLFHKMPEPDVVAWNAMIAGYAQNEFVEEAQDIFDKMTDNLHPKEVAPYVLLSDIYAVAGRQVTSTSIGNLCKLGETVWADKGIRLCAQLKISLACCGGAIEGPNSLTPL
eukprot:Gb_06359 [translate_table: standard]